MPAGYGWYPNEFIPTCKRWVENNFSNLIHFTYMKKGGHFNAFEVPDMFVEDVRVFVRKVEVNTERASCCYHLLVSFFYYLAILNIALNICLLNFLLKFMLYCCSSTFLNIAKLCSL